MEHSENDTAHGLKKAVKQGTVMEKERAEVLVNGKNEMPIGTVNEFKGHSGRAVNAVFITTSGAKFGMTSKGNMVFLLL